MATLGLPSGTRACLFDLDGVLTQTAKLHAAAWKEMFDDYLRERAQRTGEPFVPFELLRLHALRRRQAPRRRRAIVPGVAWHRAAGRGGRRSSPGAKTSCMIELLRQSTSRPTKGRCASSRQRARPACARRSSRRASTARRCSRPPGSTTSSTRASTAWSPPRQHLAGKPAPDTFLAAARALGVEPAQAAVFEDALAGVEAGRAGHFGFVVGVDRVGPGRRAAPARRRRRGDRSGRPAGTAMIVHRGFRVEPWSLHETALEPRRAGADRVAVRALERPHRRARQPRRRRAARPARHPTSTASTSCVRCRRPRASTARPSRARRSST